MKTELDTRALLNVKEMCEYLGIGQTKARELLSNPANGFTVRIGNRLYAHKGRLDHWLLNQLLSLIRTRRSFKMRIQFLKRIDNCKVLW